MRDQEVFGAIGAQLSAHGSITLQDIVDTTGISVGSLYHRYNTREELLARAWIDAVTAFQSRFLVELDSKAKDAGVRAALITPQFCRDDVERAKILICCRREELVAASIPAALSEQIRTINASVAGSLVKFAKTNRVTVEACKLGLIAFPLGAVRLYLPNQSVPKQVDDYVARACQSALNAK